MATQDNKWFAKDVRESSEVQETVDLTRTKYSRFDDTWLSITWLLARNAEDVSREYKGFRLYKHSGLPLNEAPAVTLLFTIEENVIEIISIKISDAEIFEEDFDI
jgi:hypothetical protein